MSQHVTSEEERRAGQQHAACMRTTPWTERGQVCEQSTEDAETQRESMHVS